MKEEEEEKKENEEEEKEEVEEEKEKEKEETPKQGEASIQVNRGDIPCQHKAEVQRGERGSGPWRTSSHWSTTMASTHAIIQPLLLPQHNLVTPKTQQQYSCYTQPFGN